MAASVQVRSLVKHYGGVRAVDGVSFDVEDGEVLGILGPNGAGKSTTVECVSGLRRPDSGSVSVLGHDPQTDRDAVRAVLGVQLQESRLPDALTPREALALYASFYPRPADGLELAEVLGLGGRLDARYRDLSGGQQQRLSIALALVGRPRVVVLDELTTGLDPQARRDVWSLVSDVRASGVTVLLVTHSMEEAEHLCDRVGIVADGRLVALDAPGALAAALPEDQVVRFVPSAPVDLQLLAALGDVRSVRREGSYVVVRGGPDALWQVSAVLARAGTVARGLRVETSSLDDAYLALTSPPATSTASTQETR